MNTVLPAADFLRIRSLRKVVSLTTAMLLCAAASVASAQQAFKTPDEAASALVSAAKTGDRKAIVTVLGPDGEDIVSSGDDVADAATRQKFVAAYDAKHQIAMEGDNKATMVIGQEDFPLPIPLVRKDGMWRFDTAAGRQEILARRIGQNELDAIQASLAYVDAQNEYAEKDRTGAGVKHMPNASSASRERRTDSIGRRLKVKRRAPLASSSPRQPHKATGLEAGGHPSTATISRS